MIAKVASTALIQNKVYIVPPSEHDALYLLVQSDEKQITQILSQIMCHLFAPIIEQMFEGHNCEETNFDKT